VTTAQKAIVACDGPGCTETHGEGEHTIPPGWYSVAGEESGDFCSVGCLATWAMARATDLTREEATP
jgi:hypothetical protein